MMKETSENSSLIYNFQKNNLYSTYMSVIETIDESSNSSLSFYELTAPQKYQNEFFSNMRFPMYKNKSK